jgi:hypothetical protein
VYVYLIVVTNYKNIGHLVTKVTMITVGTPIVFLVGVKIVAVKKGANVKTEEISYPQ